MLLNYFAHFEEQVKSFSRSSSNFSPCILSQINSTYGAAVLGSGLVVDDTITWTKGEVLGKGAYGVVRMQNV